MWFALISAVLWAVVDLLRKQLTAVVPVLALTAWIHVGFLPVFAAWWIAAGQPMPDAAYLPVWAVGVTIATSAQLLFLVALRTSALSVAIPMLALTPAMSSLIAWAVLGEAPSTLQGIGIGTIVAGCLVNGLVGADGRPHLDRGALLMAGVALLWSCFGVIDRAAMAHAAPPVHGMGLTGGSFLALTALLAARGELATLRIEADHRPTLGLAMLVLGGAWSMQLLALQTELVGVVEAVKRGIGLPASVLLGAAMLGETIQPARIVAVVGIAAGVAALATA